MSSGVPLSWNGNVPPVLAARTQDRPKSVPDGLTAQGVFLFIIGLTVAASAFERTRLPLGSLHVHLYLFVMAPFFLYHMTTSLREFPTLPLTMLILFFVMYVISSLSGGRINYNESIKLVASVLTLITSALMVRSTADFRAGVIGLSMAIGFLAFFGIETADQLGRNIMDTGNKNTYSLYALPAMLLAGYLLVKQKSASMLTKGILLACTFGPLLVIFMGGNRSGWLGCVVVALMVTVLRGFSPRAVLLVGLLGYSAFFAITHFGTTRIFESRMQQTLQGNESDETRGALILAALQIGLENPIVGVSPQLLPAELARHMALAVAETSSHNVVGELVGSTGLICSGALLLLAILLWRFKPLDPAVPLSRDFKDARRLLRMMLILWLCRGMFTAEILYSPSFSLSLGLLIGLCIVTSRRDQAQFNSPRQRPNPAVATFSRPLPPGLAT